MPDQSLPLRKRILREGVDRRKKVAVDVPELELGEPLWVRELTAKELDEYEASRVKVRGKEVRPDMENARAHLVVMATVDAAGQPVFAHGDVRLVGDLPASVVERLYDAAAKLSGIRKDDAKEEDDSLKNGQPSASPTGSP
jgi:hypothetical protein